MTINILKWLSDLFNSAKRAYNKLSVEEQNAMIHGSGVVAIINSMLNDSPQAVKEAILDKFPSLDVDRLEKGLFEIAKAWNLTGFSNLNEVIVALQEYLSGLQGEVWGGVSHALACVLAIFFAPSPTVKVEAVVSLMEFVYKTFIAKKKWNLSIY